MMALQVAAGAARFFTLDAQSKAVDFVDVPGASVFLRISQELTNGARSVSSLRKTGLFFNAL
jgi:hypothetical protein